MYNFSKFFEAGGKQISKRITNLALAGVLGFSGLTFAAPLFLSQTAYAATLSVCTSGCTYSTIQAAVTAATSGDIITVAAGNYSGAITINKNLTLQGAQVGVDARTRDVDGAVDSQESIISTNGVGITINSGIVTIDGFKFTTTGDGISDVSGSVNRIQNNIFSGISGAHAADGQFANTTIYQNRVENSEYGFEANSIDSGNNSVTIDSNKFVNTSQYDIAFLHGGTGIVISNNQRINGSGNFIALFGTASGAQISGNTVSNISSSVVYVGSSGTSLTISGNTFSGNASKAINVAGLANSGISISGNDLSNNTYGIYVGSGALSGTLSATDKNNLSNNSSYSIYNNAASGGSVNAPLNYWGADPSTLISGAVIYSPYYTDSAMTVRSDGTVLPDNSGNATATSSNPTVVVSSNTNPVNVTVSSGTNNAALDFSALQSGSSATLPQTTVTTQNANVQIQSGTTVTASGGTWDGKITLPTVQTNANISIPTPSGTSTSVGTVIEVGSGSVSLTFDKPVRLLISGQAGKLVGFVRNGVFTQISTLCTADNASTALSANGDCYLNVGNDMVVWTKHFTQFVTYVRNNTYTVQPGDTFYSIAAKVGLTVAQLEALNPSAGHPAGNFDFILPGDVLSIGSAIVPASVVATGPAGGSTPSTTSQSTGKVSAKSSAKVASTASVKEASGLKWYWYLVITFGAIAALSALYALQSGQLAKVTKKSKK